VHSVKLLTVISDSVARTVKGMRQTERRQLLSLCTGTGGIINLLSCLCQISEVKQSFRHIFGKLIGSKSRLSTATTGGQGNEFVDSL